MLFAVGALLAVVLSVAEASEPRRYLVLAIVYTLTVSSILIGYQARLSGPLHHAGVALAVFFPFFVIGFLVRGALLPRSAGARLLLVTLAFAAASALAMLAGVNSGLIPLF